MAEIPAQAEATPYPAPGVAVVDAGPAPHRLKVGVLKGADLQHNHQTSSSDMEHSAASDAQVPLESVL